MNPEPPGDTPGRAEPHREPLDAASSRTQPLREVLEFGREHLALVLVAGVVAIGIAVTYLTRAQAHSIPLTVATPAVTASASASGPAATGGGEVATASPSAPITPRMIVVQVLGPVKRPGVITVPEGTRVTEAIARCGGLTAAAAPGDLNLAAILHDADQVVIGTRARPGGAVRGGDQAADPAASASPSAGQPVDLNTATAAQLDQIPGIGPITAQKILDWRDQHGRFTAVTELREIDGIGAKTFARIAPHVRI